METTPVNTTESIGFWASDLPALVVEGVFDWPFLGTVILCLIFFLFKAQLGERISAVNEMNLLGKTKITLGQKEIPADEIGKELTKSFRELEQRVEKLEGLEPGPPEAESQRLSKEDDVPDGMRDFLWGRIFPMLNSDYWVARYVDTLARNTSTSEKLMENFLRSRPDVEVFSDGDRLAAMLKSKSRVGNGK